MPGPSSALATSLFCVFWELMPIPLIQGTLKYAYRADPAIAGDRDSVVATKPVEPSEYRWEAVVGPPFGCASPAAHAELLARIAKVDAVAPLAAEKEPARPRQVVIVSHGMFLSKLLGSLTGHSAYHYNAGVTRLDLSPGTDRVHMQFVNSVAHLVVAGDPQLMPKGVGGGLV